MNLSPIVSRLSIQDRQSGEIIKLAPNWAQLELLDVINKQLERKQPVRVIILKARQLGMSTMTQALNYSWAFIRENFHSLTVAHENDLSAKLLEMTEMFWERDPFSKLYTPKYESKKHKSWKETKSSLRIATA